MRGYVDKAGEVMWEEGNRFQVPTPDFVERSRFLSPKKGRWRSHGAVTLDNHVITSFRG
jgi:hypothetical protein